VIEHDGDLDLSSPEGMLALLAFPGLGSQTARRLAAVFPTQGALLEAQDEDLEHLARAPVGAVVRVGEEWSRAREEARIIINEADEYGVRVLAFGSLEYPALLRVIADPPAILYVKGVLRSDDRYVACAGTRKPTAFGVQAARRIAKALVQADFGVVSGLALGIDSAIHEATLEAGGHTVAILANGLDQVYPRANASLAEMILTQSGALLSERPFGVPATAQNLVARDRLQSGMSRATVVIQTGLRGGTLHTARFTLEQERQLFVTVPPASWAEEPESQGNLALGTMAGPEAADALGATRTYRTLLCSRFLDRPPAAAIRGKDDYPALIAALDGPSGGQPAPPPALPTTKPTGGQLGLDLS
jgi:DNA processing protein